MSQREILYIMMDHEKEFMTIKELVACTGSNKETLRHAMQLLQKKGWVEKIHGKNHFGYRIKTECVTALKILGVDNVV